MVSRLDQSQARRSEPNQPSRPRGPRPNKEKMYPAFSNPSYEYGNPNYEYGNPITSMETRLRVWQPNYEYGNPITSIETQLRVWKPNYEYGNPIISMATPLRVWKPNYEYGNPTTSMETQLREWKPNKSDSRHLRETTISPTNNQSVTSAVPTHTSPPINQPMGLFIWLSLRLFHHTPH